MTSAAIASDLPAPLVASAQDASPHSTASPTRRDTHELWVALAGESPAMGTLGITPGQRFAAAGFRVRRLVGESARVALRYTIDFIPAAVTSKPIVYPNNGAGPACTEALCSERGPLFGDGMAFGFGVSPVGAELVLGPRSRTQLSLGVTGGALLFDRPVPITSGTRFNFTATASVGLAFLSERGRGVTVGYRLHHLSNAGFAANNPGLASHMFVAGLHWGR